MTGVSGGGDRLPRELLAELSHAVGRYIECDERPRPVALWTAMCYAQEAAAVYFNTVVAAVAVTDVPLRGPMFIPDPHGGPGATVDM